MTRRAVVVGAGVLGAATADALAGAGWRVTLVEQVVPGHTGASSGGASRLLRAAHGADVAHAVLSRQAREAWMALGHDAGGELLVPSGLVWFAHSQDGWEADSARVLSGLGVPVERLAPSEGARWFPSFDGGDLAFLLHEPEAGILHARRAVRALVARAVARGAEVVAGRAEPRGAGAEIVSGPGVGEVLAADAVVWACGPWLPRLFPGLVRARVTRQDVVFFGVDASWRTPPVPGWVDFDGPFYGLGDLHGDGFKVSSDEAGAPFDPDRDERLADATLIAGARRYLERRFPALAGAPVSMTRVCQYTSTPDTRWIVAPHPDHPTVWLVGGGSGHAFKHGPAIGTMVRDLLTGAAAPDPGYGLTARDTGVSLRTAGHRA